MKTKRVNGIALVALMGAVLMAGAATAQATSRVVVTAQADIRVWLDDTRDVYPDYDDVVISLQATRDCYATVFVVDTDGYVHIVRPLSPWDRAWIRGGHTYRYTGRELGLARLTGRGIAHVFAISSPDPFDYSPYGEEIFAGHCGFRIYGDPFIAGRQIYLSLLPARCHPDMVSVSFARFYIREWTRYPGYLCRGHGGLHVRVGDYCRQCSHLYDGYRMHVADPYVVIDPRARFNKRQSYYAEVKRSTVKYKSSARNEAVAGWSRAEGRRVASGRSANRVVSRKSVETRKSVVSRRPVTPRKSSRLVEKVRKTSSHVTRPASTRRGTTSKSRVSTVTRKSSSSKSRATAPARASSRKVKGSSRKAR